MKHSKLILIVAAVIGLSSFSANAVGLNAKLIFENDGSPESIALAKKCQTLEDKAYELILKADKIRTSNEYHSETDESKSIKQEGLKLRRSAMKMCNNKFQWSN